MPDLRLCLLALALLGLSACSSDEPAPEADDGPVVVVAPGKEDNFFAP